MVNKISFKNYRLFKEKQQLEIKPITILIGKNNTGKSAILKLLPLIESALKAKDELPFSKNWEGLNLATDFKDLIYGKYSRALTIELFQDNIADGNVEKLKVDVAVDSQSDTPILFSWELNEDLKLSRISNGVFINDIDGSEYNCEFNGFNLLNYFYRDKPDSSGTHYAQTFNLETDFISSFRELPKLDYRLKSLSTHKSGTDGSNLYDFLIKDYLTTEKLYFSRVSNWIKEKFEGWELYVDVDSEPYHIELRKEKLSINLTETGIGIGQSLPLITRAYKPCEKETLIIIEEPESHLHPYAHAQLAQLFSDSIVLDENKKYLIETHSQNFILRFRRLIAEGNLKAINVNIYYVDFNEEKNESNLIKINLDDNGGVDWWPEGIFSETTSETRAIYNAQLNDIKDVGTNR